ncbi:Replication protein A 70 kDa DNA-binding subunit D [Abeliophyllum distichum]|uniref:Replication protein A 70 kDa DNA-binding subunit D n=1 Tax=Abeliophyllum distichum TaxID=126358 RepID=A0ABD1Q777_9LAMI
MGDKFQLIHDVSPGTTGWTVKVVVAEKFSPKVAQRSPTKYQNLTLMDSEGSTVQATLYGQNITAFQDELLLGKTYLISNALVKETNAEYKAKSGEIQWTISGRTRIRRVEENNSNLLISTYSFTDFEDLPKYMDSNVDISVIGMIIDIKPRRIIQTRFGKECQVQDLVLVNKRFDTVLLTMWETFVDNECKYICQNLRKKLILIGKHLKVTSFNGLSISTKADSSFFIDGEFELVEEFKSWGHTNSKIIDNMISEKHYLTSTPSKLSSKLSVPTAEKDFTEIKNIQGLKTAKQFFWIKGKASVKVLNQTYWYMSCNNCNKISSENYGDIYPCVFCKCTDAKAIPRAKVYMQLTDPTGYINATAIGNPAEYFLQSNAEILMNQTLIPTAASMRLSMDEDEIFYVKAMTQELSTDCKFEILFIVNPSQIAGDKNTGKAPVEHIGEPIKFLEPTTKRSLFHSDTDDAQSSKKNVTSQRLRSRKKINEF